MILSLLFTYTYFSFFFTFFTQTRNSGSLNPFFKCKVSYWATSSWTTFLSWYNHFKNQLALSYKTENLYTLQPNNSTPIINRGMVKWIVAYSPTGILCGSDKLMNHSNTQHRQILPKNWGKKTSCRKVHI